MAAIDSHSIFFSYYMKVSGYWQLSGYQFLLNIFFCVQQKNDTHSGWEQLEGE